MLKSLYLTVFLAGFTLFISPAFTADEATVETQQFEDRSEQVANETNCESENNAEGQESVAFLKIPIKTFA